MTKLEKIDDDYYIRIPKSVVKSLDWNENKNLKLVFRSESLVVKEE